MNLLEPTTRISSTASADFTIKSIRVSLFEQTSISLFYSPIKKSFSVDVEAHAESRVSPVVL